MRRSDRVGGPLADQWYSEGLYDVWPTKVPDTISGLALTAALFERDGDHAKAEQIRKGIKAFEGRDPKPW